MKVLAIGDAALMDGFSLLGVEIHADRTAEQINQLLSELKKQRQRALVYMQQDLDQDNIPMLNEIRNQGGRILICEIPNLQQASSYQPAVEKLISRVLGSSVLESRHGR